MFAKHSARTTAVLAALSASLFAAAASAQGAPPQPPPQPGPSANVPAQPGPTAAQPAPGAQPVPGQPPVGQPPAQPGPQPGMPPSQPGPQPGMPPSQPGPQPGMPPSWGPVPGQPPSQPGPQPGQPQPWTPPAPQGGWGADPTAAPAAPPALPPEPIDGVTKEGYPITKRGHVALELSAIEINTGFDGTSGSFIATPSIDASARLTGGLFANARFSSGAFLFPGNLMAGADYLIKVGKSNWITVGGALGIPLAQSSQTFSYSLTNAMWNLHEFAPKYEPLRVDLGYEMVSKSWGLRLDLQPVLYFPFDQNGADVEFAFQHAVEVQYGHSLGAGLRLQGVANTLATDDYQAAIEPFVFVRRDMGFARLGLLKTLDEDQSSPYREAWGARFSAGFHID